jgi:hypothetical protein
MKRNIFFKSFVAVAVASSLAGCDENAWNNDLDGFKDQLNSPLTNAQTIEYTLTASDYASIAGNSTNVALAGDDLKSALAAVGTRKAFSDQIPAAQYIPAFLNSSSFSYFTLTDGSAVKLTYNVSQGLPAELDEAAAAQTYTLTDEDYQYVWGSSDNFISAFAPSHTAAKNLPGLLADALDANDGLYCVVSYNESTQEPVFGSVNGGGETASFQPTSVIGSVELNGAYTIKGVVTGVCTLGYIVTDNSGSIFVYMGSSFDTSTIAVGNQVEIEGTIGAYNKGFQVTGSSATVNIVGSQAVTYPSAKVYTGADLDQAITRTDNETAVYAQINGTVAVSGNNINIVVDGAETAKGSVYGASSALKEVLTDGANVTVKGYFIAIAGSRYCNFVVTDVNGKAYAPKRSKKAIAKAAAVDVPTTKINDLYYYNGSKWVLASGFTVLNDADYTAMGQTYKNLTAPANYLPAYLKTTFPYAQADDTKNVVYTFYNGSKSYLMCDQYIYNGNEWTLNDGIVTETTQFVRSNGEWMYDPNVTITLPAGKSQELSTTYYQACVNWVYENICKPLGDTSIKSGKFYVSSYGNNEYYSGTSAYQGNVDLRASAAKGQYPAEYENMADDDVVALMKSRFMNEVMPGALSTLHPDAKPVDGIDVIYTINFAAYTGTTNYYVARFKVVGVGKFEPIDCTWDD